MASRFASVTEDQLLSINEAAFPKNTKVATKLDRLIIQLVYIVHTKTIINLSVGESGGYLLYSILSYSEYL